MFEICDLLSLVFLLPSIKNMQNAKRFNSKFAFLFFSWNSWLEIWRKILRIVFDNTRSFVLAELKNNKNWKSFLLFFYDLTYIVSSFSLRCSEWHSDVILFCSLIKKNHQKMQNFVFPRASLPSFRRKKREEKIILFFVFRLKRPKYLWRICCVRLVGMRICDAHAAIVCQGSNSLHYINFT